MSATPREGIAQSLAETFIAHARAHGDLPPRRWKDLEPHAREIWYATAHAPVITALLAVARLIGTHNCECTDHSPCMADTTRTSCMLYDAIRALDAQFPGWKEWGV